MKPPEDPVLREVALRQVWRHRGDGLGQPWLGLVAFDLARSVLAGALADLDSSHRELDDLLRGALDCHVLAPWPGLVRAVVLKSQGSSEAAVEALLGSGETLDNRPVGWPLETATVLARELAEVAVYGQISQLPPPLTWGPRGEWTVVRQRQKSTSFRVPDALAVAEFQDLQHRGVADLYFCLPPRGTAWIRTRTSEPQSALPQVLRVLTRLAESASVQEEALRESALGEEATAAALDKAISRARRLLRHLGFAEETLTRHSGFVRLSGCEVAGLVSSWGRRPEVRVRRDRVVPDASELIGWAPTAS